MEIINQTIFLAINQLAGTYQLLDKLIVLLANDSPYLFILFLFYLWFSKHNYKNSALLAGYGAILGVTLNFVITLFYFHPRPFMDGLGKTLFIHIPDTSFPSDHTTFMLAIAFTLLAFKKTRKYGLFLSVFGILGGLARVYSGIHYPFDIAGSILVASLTAFIIYSLERHLRQLNGIIINIYYKIIHFKIKKQDNIQS